MLAAGTAVSSLYPTLSPAGPPTGFQPHSTPALASALVARGVSGALKLGQVSIFVLVTFVLTFAIGNPP